MGGTDSPHWGPGTRSRCGSQKDSPGNRRKKGNNEQQAEQEQLFEPPSLVGDLWNLGGSKDATNHVGWGNVGVKGKHLPPAPYPRPTIPDGFSLLRLQILYVSLRSSSLQDPDLFSELPQAAGQAMSCPIWHSPGKEDAFPPPRSSMGRGRSKQPSANPSSALALP